MESGAGITVGHENLRSGMGLRQATPHPGVLLTSSRHACYQRPGQVHLAGQRVLVIARDFTLAIYGQQGLLRRLTIDTTRRYQPTGIPPGRRR
jgi:hypothetical protein